MDVAIKFPVTLAERLEMEADEPRFPGTLAEFADLLEVCEYPLEFQNGEIIAMSIASDPHERIVANILFVLGLIFKGEQLYRRYGSNRHVFIPEVPAAYSPDASVVQGRPDIIEYAKGKTANLNPWLLVEVMSGSTRGKDYAEKLPRYKKMPTVQYIVYLEQDFPLVTVFQRSAETGRWISMDYDSLEQSFIIEGREVLLSDIYENIFDAA